MTSTQSTYEWRAVARDTGDMTVDYEGPFDTRQEAEMILPLLMDAEPTYDEGWIERRPKVEWERVDHG
jgi:hypothetical protein